jgi:hypothetical protein
MRRTHNAKSYLWFALAFGGWVIIHLSVTFLLPANESLIRKMVDEALLILGCALAIALLERWYIHEKTIEAFARVIADIFDARDRLTNNAHKCGLTALYPNREDAANEIHADIEGSKRRVWLLGVSLTRFVTLDELSSMLIDKASQGQDVKLLLMDSTTSPSVFRTVLESPPESVKLVLDGLVSKTDAHANAPAISAYCDEHLFADVQRATLHLLRARERSAFGAGVKFYAHSATCWMVVADDVLYYQPYSFGRPSGVELTETIGPFMPVFRYSKQISDYPFHIFEDHFEKMWRTTTTDLSEMERRLNDHRNLLETVFVNRYDWLKQACGELSRRSRGAKFQKALRTEHVP